MVRRMLGLVLLLSGALGWQPGEGRAPLGIPYKPDPPPAVDGDLGEWIHVPNALSLQQKEQVVFGAANWTSPADLSATVWLAWRREHLYLAAEVTDDRFRQNRRGEDLWKGDHVELYLDIVPGLEPQRDAFGQGQFHLGLSPGNFGQTGDPLFDLKPEAVFYRPMGLAAEGVLVAARRTERGYTLEAAVPWKVLGVEPALGIPLALEVGVSDTDGEEPAQESMMTLSSAPWGHRRSRLLPTVLASAKGQAPPTVEGGEVFREIRVPARSQREHTFSAPSVPLGREAVLFFRARLEFPKPAGYTSALRLLLNGKPLDVGRLLDKEPTEERVDGVMKNMASAGGDVFTVDYAPDFDSPDAHPNYALRRAGVKVCDFAFRITDLLRPGENTLLIENAIRAPLTNELVLGQGRVEFRLPTAPPKKKGPPTGPLPVFEPAKERRVDFTLHQPAEHLLLIEAEGETFRVESEFSTPVGRWEQGSNRFFDLRRRIERQGEVILVFDTFTNRTEENLPLMQRHRAQRVGGGGKALPWQRVWLAGLAPASRTGMVSQPANPTTFGIAERMGLGLLPLNDEFLVHTTNFSDGESLGLADLNFVLRPQATYTAEWAVVLVPRSLVEEPWVRGRAEGEPWLASHEPYFAFVNAVRRLRGVNFTIEGSFAFLRADPNITGKWSDEQLASFARLKSAKYLCSSIDYPRYRGVYPHGTAFQTLDHSYRKGHIARLRRLVPEALHLVYFHCFIDVLEGAEGKYADARVLLSDGTQATYGEPHDKIFFPTEGNSFGREIAKNVDIILDEIGADGVYWDEMEYSRYRYHYGEPWDGVSADIDPETMGIVRLKSSVTLITQPWRLALARRILARGPLIANGAPHTRTMAQLHFPRFVETGSISNCTLAQLFTPIALGDHLTERSEADAYRVMLRALDYGCVYYWYGDVTVVPTHPHLTQFMFPVTPLELHEGFILGRERILTNRSGLFGWGDGSRHEVHLFDEEGREVPPKEREGFVKTVLQEGRTFTELRLPEGWSAAVVRQ